MGSRPEPLAIHRFINLWNPYYRIDRRWSNGLGICHIKKPQIRSPHPLFLLVVNGPSSEPSPLPCPTYWDFVCFCSNPRFMDADPPSSVWWLYSAWGISLSLGSCTGYAIKDCKTNSFAIYCWTAWCEIFWDRKQFSFIKSLTQCEKISQQYRRTRIPTQLMPWDS